MGLTVSERSTIEIKTDATPAVVPRVEISIESRIKLKAMISSKLEDLDSIHHQFPFVPNSKQASKSMHESILGIMNNRFMIDSTES